MLSMPVKGRSGTWWGCRMCCRSAVSSSSGTPRDPASAEPPGRYSLRYLKLLRQFRQGYGGGDVREMGECLGEVPEHLVGFRVVLLREEPELVAGGYRPVEDAAGPLQPSLAREALGQPERTGQKGSFLTLEPVFDLLARQVAS